MENVDANQLPEVDSLPDGFVESTNEPMAPPTPTLEQEKPLTDCNEDSISEIDHSNERIPSLEANGSQIKQESNEKTEKLRPLPISLSEIDGFDAPEQLEEVPDKASGDQAEGTMAILISANLVYEVPMGTCM